MTNLGDIFEVLGYVPEDDAWDTDGRRTYLHEDPASPAYLRVLQGTLARHGWQLDTTTLRTFRHFSTHEVIEIEAGGDDSMGHLLHHMKAEVVA